MGHCCGTGWRPGLCRGGQPAGVDQHQGGGQSRQTAPALTPSALCPDIPGIVPLPLFLLSLPSFRLASFLACTISSHKLVFLPSVPFAASLCIFTTFFSKSWSELSFGSQVSEIVASHCYIATSDSLSMVSALRPSPARSLGQTQPVSVSLHTPVLLQGPCLPSYLL